MYLHIAHLHRAWNLDVREIKLNHTQVTAKPWFYFFFLKFWADVFPQVQKNISIH